MRQNLVKLLLVLSISSVVLIFSNGIKLNAYAYYALGWNDAQYTLDIGEGRYNDIWLNHIQMAVDSWNATATPVNITVDMSSDLKVYAAQYADTWYGQYVATYYWFFGYHVTKFSIRLNARTISLSSTPSTWTFFVRSVIVHEIGHSLSLHHNSEPDSIMNTSRNRETMYTPQQDDIDGVNVYY